MLLPGSSINLSLLPLNSSFKQVINSSGLGWLLLSYETPNPPPKSKKSREIPISEI